MRFLLGLCRFLQFFPEKWGKERERLQAAFRSELPVMPFLRPLGLLVVETSRHVHGWSRA